MAAPSEEEFLAVYRLEIVADKAFDTAPGGTYKPAPRRDPGAEKTPRVSLFDIVDRGKGCVGGGVGC
jgi:hypothetical protein